MNSPRRKPRITAENALLLGALALFLAGSAWVAHNRGTSGAAEAGSWLGSLPTLGLPVVHTILSR